MATSDGWFVLAGTVAGVVLSSGTTLTTSVLHRRWTVQDAERARQSTTEQVISNRCRQAAHDYLVAANGYYRVLDEAHDRSKAGETVNSRHLARDAFTALQDAYIYLTISTGTEVRTLAHELNMALYALHDVMQSTPDAWDAADQNVYGVRNALRKAIRTELGTPD